MNLENATKVLLEFKEILDRVHIKFWLTCGTLLAAVRNGNFIPYDDDIDLIVLARDWNFAFYSILKKEFEIAGFSPVWRVFLKKYNIRIDICPYCYYAPKDIFVYPRKFRGGSEVREIPRAWLEETAFIKFLDRTFRIPCQSKKLLTLMYGPTWRIPQDSGWESAGAPWIPPSEFMPWFEKHPEKLLRDIKHWNFSSIIGKKS